MFNDTPVVHDDPMECETCKRITTHHRVIYKDVEYRTCTRCHTKTTLKLTEDHTLEQTSKTRKDTSIPKYDKRRTENFGQWRKGWSKKAKPEDDDE